MPTRWRWPPENCRGCASSAREPQADELEQLLAAGVDRVRGHHLVEPQQLAERLPHRHARVERRVGILEDHLDPTPHAPARASRRAARPRIGAPRPSARRGRRCSARASTSRSPTRRPGRAPRPRAISRSTPSTARRTRRSSRRMALTTLLLSGKCLTRPAYLEQRLSHRRSPAPVARLRRRASEWMHAVARSPRQSASAGTPRRCSPAARRHSAGGSGSPAAARRGRAASPGSSSASPAPGRRRAPSAAGSSVYGWRGSRNTLVDRPGLDDLAGVHDGDASGTSGRRPRGRGRRRRC